MIVLNLFEDIETENWMILKKKKIITYISAAFFFFLKNTYL